MNINIRHKIDRLSKHKKSHLVIGSFLWLYPKSRQAVRWDLNNNMSLQYITMIYLYHTDILCTTMISALFRFFYLQFHSKSCLIFLNEAALFMSVNAVMLIRHFILIRLTLLVLSAHLKISTLPCTPSKPSPAPLHTARCPAHSPAAHG